MAYGDFKDLNRRTITDKVLRDKAFNIDKNQKYDGYQRKLASMVYKFLIKNPLHLQINLLLVTVKNEIICNINKPVIRKFEKRKVHSTFLDNVCGEDLADMQLINKFNKGLRFLLCAIDIYAKYAWVRKDKKDKKIKKELQLLMLFKNF